MWPPGIGAAGGTALDRDVVEILPARDLDALVVAPASKSVTNRLLVLAALADGESRIGGPLVSLDTEAMVRGLGTLGTKVQRDDGLWRVGGRAGEVSAPTGTVDAGLSGTTLRFLAAMSALAPSAVEIDGSEPLRRRPIAGLADALRDLGAVVSLTEGRLPMRIEPAGLQGGVVNVRAGESSQFATAVLLIAPYASGDLLVRVHGLGASGYLRLTIDAMERWGAHVSVLAGDATPGEGGCSRSPWEIRVSSRDRYSAREETVEHDASAAAHLLALAMAAGGRVTVTNAAEGSLQPDAGITEIFEAMGALVSAGPGGIAVERSGRLRCVDADLSAMPDQLPTVAVLAALAEGESRISNVGIARGHETDRVAATACELRRLGADVDELAGGLVVRGGKRLHSGRVDTYGDHRMAMAFAALGTAVPGVEIADPGCVAKTYPGFWDDLAAAGLVAAPGRH